MRFWIVAAFVVSIGFPGVLRAQTGASTQQEADRTPRAQEEKEMSVLDGCKDCELGSEEILSILGLEGDLGFANALSSIARDSQGRYWMVFGQAAAVTVIDREGKTVGVVGRRGGGPGEFFSPTALVPVGDSVVVFDVANQRATVVGPNLQVARSFRLVGQVFGGVAPEWPRIIVNGVLSTPTSVGHPYHVLNIESGLVERSFGGAPGGDFTPRDTPLLLGHIALDPNGQEVWTVTRARFRLQRWTLDGQLLQGLTPDPDLFPPHGRAGAGNRNKPPDPAVLAMEFSGEDLLVFFHVARSDWEKSWVGYPRGEDPHMRLKDLPDSRDLRRSLIALIDTREGSITRIWEHPVYPVGWSHMPGTLVEVEDEMIPIIRFKQFWIDRK